MSMNSIPRQLSQEDQDLIAEYLKNGGNITKGKPGVYTNDPSNFHSWGNKKAKQNTEQPTTEIEDTE